MSAYGFLVAKPSIELVRALVTPLDGTNAGAINGLFAEMEREGRALLRSAGVRPADINVKREVAVHYAGQSYELIVPIPAGKLTGTHLEAVQRAFETRYQQRYHPPEDSHLRDDNLGRHSLGWRASLRLLGGD